MARRQADSSAGRSSRPATSAFAKDIRRTVTGNLKIFLSIAVITALGVGVLVGLEAACDDLRFSADDYFDEQHLYDISVQSTLGLTDDDIDALAALDDVEVAEGGYAETAYTEVDGTPEKVDVKALSDEGLNAPQLVDGRLPEAADEVAVTQKYLNASGKKIGDEVTFASDAGLGEDADAAAADADAADTDDAGDASSTEVFKSGSYTITGVVLDPMDVNPDGSVMTFRTSTSTKYAFFLTRAAVEDPDVYTIAYLAVSGACDLVCYGDEYEELIARMKDEADAIRAEREEARTSSVVKTATDAVDEAEAEAEEKLADAEQQLDDAQATIDENAATIADGKSELAAQEASAAEQIAAGQQQIGDGAAQLDAALKAANQQVEEQARAQAEAAVPATVASTLEGMDEYQQLTTLSQTFDQLEQAVDQLEQQVAAIEAKGDAATAEETAQLEAAKAQLEANRAQLAAVEAQAGMTSAEADAALAQLEEAVTASVTAAVEETLPAQIAAAQKKVYEENFKSRYQELADAQAELDAQSASAAEQIASARAELEAGEAKLADGQAELDENRTAFEEERADARAQIADARAEVDDIEPATWYILDRSSISSYSSLGSDADCIESIATVFPLIFFAVAALISSTTITRMVEEERELIGLYKALGYRRGQIMLKYLAYALSASLAGAFAGEVIGFIILPEILFIVFSSMYVLPAYGLAFNLVYALIGVALFTVGIVGATVLSCYRAFKEVPASLMRPRAPRAGSRILLERVTPLWRRMGFLNKVTARNLFRYKKRFLMTVLGIAGCTGLMICGLGIRDTVSSFKTRQYGSTGVSHYDLMAVTTAGDYAAAEELLAGADEVEGYLACRIDSVTAQFGEEKETIQIMVVPDGADLARYVKLEDDAAGELELPRDGNGAVITVNAEQVLGFSVGDEISLQDSSLHEGTVSIAGVQINYLGNFVYMTQSAYEEAFGRAYEANAFLAMLSGSKAEQIEFCDGLTDANLFVSISSTAKLSNQFSESFKILDMVVYLLTIMAACLAFAVVFTLSTTNISERERELATIKVLGFRRGEVYRYINKETVILAVIGVAVGCPLGFGLVRFLSWVLRMPSLYFDTLVDPVTYVIAGALSLVFVFIVNRITNRSLDRVDMVGALKSAE